MNIQRKPYPLHSLLESGKCSGRENGAGKGDWGCRVWCETTGGRSDKWGWAPEKAVFEQEPAQGKDVSHRDLKMGDASQICVSFNQQQTSQQNINQIIWKVVELYKYWYYLAGFPILIKTGFHWAKVSNKTFLTDIFIKISTNSSLEQGTKNYCNKK